MAVTPLFNSDLASLMAKLRMSGVKDDGLAVVTDCLLQVRFGLFKRVTSARVTQILGYASTDSPSTDDELTRSRANASEVTWMRMLLLRRLPILFIQGADGTRDIWNQEGLTREARQSELDKEINRLQADLDDLLDELDLEDDTANEGGVQVYVGTPVTPTPRPGGTAFGNRRTRMFPPYGNCTL